MHYVRYKLSVEQRLEFEKIHTDLITCFAVPAKPRLADGDAQD